MPVDSKIISSAMRELAKTIQCDDGVANAACYQAADLIDEQRDMIELLKKELESTRGTPKEPF